MREMSESERVALAAKDYMQEKRRREGPSLAWSDHRHSGRRSEEVSQFRCGVDVPSLSFSSASEFDGLAVPRREWIIDGLVPDSVVTMLSGDGGTGKSLLALQLAAAVATGRAWVGRMPNRAGPAMVLSAEDDSAELHRRLADIAAAEDLSLADLAPLHIASLAGEDALLATLDKKSNTLAATALYDALDRRMAEIEPVLLVLDTLADLTAGDENTRSHARQFVGFLRRLALRHRCAVVLLAHPSLTGMSSGSGLSGSTAWNGSVRSRLYLKRIAEEGHDPNPDRRLLRTMKSNYGPTGDEIKLTWRAGVLEADPPETQFARGAASAKAERVFLTLLQLLDEQGRRVNANGGINYAPKIFAEHPKAEGVTRRAFGAAMESLFASGKIRNGVGGPPSRPTSFIVVSVPSATAAGLFPRRES